MSIILPHVFQDGSIETASGVQVNEDLNVLKAAIEAVEARVGEAYPAIGPYSARTTATVGTPVTNSSGHRQHVIVDFSASNAAIVKIKVGGVFVAELYVPPEAAGGTVAEGHSLRMSTSFVVGSGEAWVVESGGGFGPVEDLHFSARVI